jgi:hypothetical protein
VGLNLTHTNFKKNDKLGVLAKLGKIGENLRFFWMKSRGLNNTLRVELGTKSMDKYFRYVRFFQGIRPSTT